MVMKIDHGNNFLHLLHQGQSKRSMWWNMCRFCCYHSHRDRQQWWTSRCLQYLHFHCRYHLYRCHY